MGGKEYIVPSLNFRQLRTLGDTIAGFGSLQGGSFTGEQMDDVIKVVHSALTRNYPEITVTDVEDMLDLNNATDVIGAILGASGLKKVQSVPVTPNL